MMSLAMAFQLMIPWELALMPLDLSFCAIWSIPVEKTLNPPRMR
jgi:hypothetical protein